MKNNMKISSRLTLSFVLVNALYIICIILSIWSYSLSNNRLNSMNTEAVQSEIAAAEMRDAILRTRISLRQLILYDPASVEYASAKSTFEAENQKAISSIAKYCETATDHSARSDANEFLSYYEFFSTDLSAKIIDLNAADHEGAVKELSSTVTDFESRVDQRLEYHSGLINGKIDFYLEDAQFGFVRLLIIAVAVFTLVIVLVIFILRYMNKTISKRIENLSRTAELLATGVLDVDISIGSTDEIGQLTKSFLSMIDSNKEQAAALTAIADGDLTVNVSPRSNSDSMGNAIEKMVNNLNRMFEEVTASTDNVSGGAGQIAYGAQALAQGATEQSSAVEELSATIAQVLTQTQDNSHSARTCLELVNKAGVEMQEAVKYMEELKSTMSGVSSSADKISQIIKVIDDIAFQTNILALNAAVEAARAGQHGKGFAVVADEVRNLASKSATAAKETAALIQTSVEYVQLGNTMVEKANQSVAKVAQTAQESHESIVEINDASQRQEESITQINVGIEQISQVVQTNSATAEESASASEELSGQAQTLKQLLGQFRIKNGSISHGYDAPMLSSPSRASYDISNIRNDDKW